MKPLTSTCLLVTQMFVTLRRCNDTKNSTIIIHRTHGLTSEEDMEQSEELRVLWISIYSCRTWYEADERLSRQFPTAKSWR
ncbi:unnamed protein product, partial [Iphiclides podalirius]